MLRNLLEDWKDCWVIYLNRQTELKLAVGVVLILLLLALQPILTYASLNTEPQWSNNQTQLSSPVTYAPSNNYGFQINWTDADNNFDNATFQLGRPSGSITNYTKATTPATNNNSASGEKIWYINFTQNQFGPAGTYNITWFGTDTAGAQNKTDTIGYRIVTIYGLYNTTFNLILHLGSAFADDSLQSTNQYACIADSTGFFGLIGESGAAKAGNVSGDYNINISQTSSDRVILAASKGSCVTFTRYVSSILAKTFLSPLQAFAYAKTNVVQFVLSYPYADFLNDLHWSAGTYQVSVRNEGYDSSSGKQKLGTKIIK